MSRIVKITGVKFSNLGQADDVVEMLVLDSIELGAYRLQKRHLGTDNAWEDLHIFQAMKLESGSRIRLNGAQCTLLPDPFCVDLPMSSSQIGSPNLPIIGVELRCLDEKGRVSSRLSVAADSEFEAESVHFLRSSDSTSVFLFPGAGGKFESGAYKLEFDYHLDITSISSNSPILSRSGDVTAETGWIALY